MTNAIHSLEEQCRIEEEEHISRSLLSLFTSHGHVEKEQQRIEEEEDDKKYIELAKRLIREEREKAGAKALEESDGSAAVPNNPTKGDNHE
ncbi:MAG: hypothetical protein EB060_04595 [Proteobacteria bacterium]|nr:hypothetical protein [Pseudomonadota bacterium]